MIGIEQVASYLPDDRIDTIELGRTLGANPDFIRNKLGFVTLSRKRCDMDVSDMCVEAFSRLEVDPNVVDCLVVVTQNPDAKGLPHTSAIVHEKLNLPSSVSCFDISLGCSGFVSGLAIICSYMHVNSLKCGVLLTADPYSKVINENDRDTALLFGDAAAATLISKDARYRIAKTTNLTQGRLHRSIEVGQDDQVSMHGNRVFRFVHKEVPAQIRECLKINAVQLDDIDLFLLHQGSKFIVETLRSAIGVDANKAPFLAGEYGNTVSSSIPLMLANHINNNYNRILISGFGVGLTASTSILERVKSGR